MALDRLGVYYDLVGWSEIDKYAIQAHNAVYPQWSDRNFGDISKIYWDNIPDFDLFTYSFPCTDISSAGRQKGLEEGSRTRSSLLWECKKAIEAKKPKYLLMENVKALTQKKFLPYLHEWDRYLRGLGYTNFTKVLNAKNYGVPQNRERVFMVSILGDAWYDFPKPFELDKVLKDVLETNVDDKYYLSPKLIDCFIRMTDKAKKKGNGFRFNPTDGYVVAKAITTHPNDRTVDNFIFSNKRFPLNENKNGKANFEREGSMAATGATDGYRIRKLTPRECFRLMGVSESDIDKIQGAGISNTQQYKMAGNSIVVDVLYFIFKNLLTSYK